MKNNHLFNSSTGLCKWIGLAAAIALPLGSHADVPKVSLLSPEPPENLFWGQAIDFAKAVAEDLGIDLDVVHPSASSDSSSYIIRRLGTSILNREVKPDYLLTGFWGNTVDLFETAANLHKIRVIMFNTDLTTEEKSLVKKPREKYPNWVAHMYPNDKQAGYELADVLVEIAHTGNQNTKLNLIALAGNTQSEVSNVRLAGLQQRANNDKTLTVHQTVSTTWTRDSAIHAAGQTLEKYPDTSIIWTVSDEVALGSIQAVKERGKQPGKDILIGGFDWSAEGLKTIKSGEMAVSMGGHFMEAGWALILAYDHYNGHDFVDDTGVEIITRMQSITKDNVDQFLQSFGDRNWNKIDFKKFSKTHNTKLEKYDFSLDAIFASME